MRRLFGLICLVAIGPGSLRADPPALDGSWRVLLAHRGDADALDDPALRDSVVTIKGDRLEWKSADGKVSHFVATIAIGEAKDKGALNEVDLVPAGGKADEPLEVQAKADAKRKQLSVREQVKLHTSINTCQLCHRKIDPLGFVWADLDYLGQKITPKPIKPNTPAPIADCSGKVPDGRTFANLAEFTALLKDEQANSRYRFGEVLLRHLTGYALARPVGLHDEAEIRELVRSARRDGWRLREVIKSIVLSQSFTHG